MPTQQPAKSDYDPRWFIWTIVFLVVTGISLVSYIVLSDTSTTDAAGVTTVHHTASATASAAKLPAKHK